ncbi:ATP cone domain-containing protein [Escherichia coli]
MNQNLLVTKRDGSTERINLDKIHRVLDWAAKDCITFRFPRSNCASHIQFYDGIKTSDIHQTIIKAAADLISRDAPDYQYLAARLAIFHLRKKAYGQFEPPALYDHVVKWSRWANPIIICWKTTKKSSSRSTRLSITTVI